MKKWYNINYRNFKVKIYLFISLFKDMVIMGNLRLESDLQYYSHFQNNFKSWGHQLGFHIFWKNNAVYVMENLFSKTGSFLC